MFKFDFLLPKETSDDMHCILNVMFPSHKDYSKLNSFSKVQDSLKEQIGYFFFENSVD